MNQKKNYFGIMMIVIGVIYLLSKIGILGINFLKALYLLWPLCVIGIGMNIIFKKRVYFTRILWSSIIIFILIVSIFGNRFAFFRNSKVTFYDTETIEVSERDKLKFNKTAFKHATLKLESLNGNIFLNSTPDYDLLSNDNVKFEAIESEDKVVFSIEDIISGVGKDQQKGHSEYTLSREKNWRIYVDAINIKADMDLSEIKVDDLDINGLNNHLEIIYGSKHSSTLSIESYSSDVHLYIPKNLGVRLEVEGLSKSVIFKDATLKDNVYTSSNYDDSKYKLDIDIEALNIDIKIDYIE